MGKSSQTNLPLYYLLSAAGLLRIINLLLGLVSIIFSVIGLVDDFGEKEYQSGRWAPYLSHYGLGYKQEKSNICNLFIVSCCFGVSLLFLVLLLAVEGAIGKWKAWNRFLNFFLGHMTLWGWLCGLLGLLLFRQGCCRVEILTAEHIPFDNQGYSEPCLCTMTPKNDPKLGYPMLGYEDASIGLGFTSALPHHFSCRVFLLMVTFLNAVVYFTAAWVV